MKCSESTILHEIVPNITKKQKIIQKVLAILIEMSYPNYRCKADWSSGQDVALSRRKQGFDSPTSC